MKQGSQEWFQARAGICTGSKADAIMGWLKQTKAEVESGIRRENAERRAYRGKIVAEILTGMPDLEGFNSGYMQWGTDNEDAARTAYELQEKEFVEQVGFMLHPSIPRMGGSPDGLVGENGIIEIKCPATSTHIRWLLDGIAPEEHQPQMEFYLSVTGRQWCDFCSYDPRLPKPLQFFTVRHNRNEEAIARLDAEVVQFNAEVDGVIGQLRLIAGPFDLPAAQQAKRPVDEAPESWLTDEELNMI